MSSIIMLGVCSFATAQNSDLRAAKASKKAATKPAFTNASAAKPENVAIIKPDASAVKSTTATKADALRADDVSTKPTAASADVEATKKNQAVKAAPVKKG